MDNIFYFITLFLSLLAGFFVGKILYKLFSNWAEKKWRITTEDVLRYIKENKEVYYGARREAIYEMLVCFTGFILIVLLVYLRIKLTP